MLSIRIRSRLVFCSVNSLCLHANHLLSPLHRTRMAVASALYQNPDSISSLCKFNMSSCESEHVSFEDRIPSDRISPVASVGIASEKNSITYWRAFVIAALSQDYPWHVRSCLYGHLKSVVHRRMHTASAGIAKRCVSGSLKNTVSPTAKEKLERVKKTVRSENS